MKSIVGLGFGFFSCSRAGGKNLSKDLLWYGYVVTSSLSCEVGMLAVVWKTLMSLFL